MADIIKNSIFDLTGAHSRSNSNHKVRSECYIIKKKKNILSQNII